MRRLCRDDEITDNQEGKVDEKYLREVEAMTARRESLHLRRERAIARLVEAEDAVRAAKSTRRRAEIKEAWRLVEERRQELAQIERLMTSAAGASSAHRGTKSIWPTHAEGSVNRGEPERGPRTKDGRKHPVRVRRAS